jgi:hypothetical protein
MHKSQLEATIPRMWFPGESLEIINEHAVRLDILPSWKLISI